ncbi:hypothetical protein UCRPC4_g03192 [Phaeomoniella chlamydospora]|uniref:Uncharacterized protein n=1 Tax=Phaeomoniella chlamydospora TaxID=158046 RepID=A0A0G2EJZ6_PHACM|nr:hypothetical protein UCRPC4_g03192 [Phaeomoniella chlamydospora]
MTSKFTDGSGDIGLMTEPALASGMDLQLDETGDQSDTTEKGDQDDTTESFSDDVETMYPSQDRNAPAIDSGPSGKRKEPVDAANPYSAWLHMHNPSKRAHIEGRHESDLPAMQELVVLSSSPPPPSGDGSDVSSKVETLTGVDLQLRQLLDHNKIFMEEHYANLHKQVVKISRDSASQVEIYCLQMRVLRGKLREKKATIDRLEAVNNLRRSKLQKVKTERRHLLTKLEIASSTINQLRAEVSQPQTEAVAKRGCEACQARHRGDED